MYFAGRKIQNISTLILFHKDYGLWYLPKLQNIYDFDRYVSISISNSLAQIMWTKRGKRSIGKLSLYM